MRNVIIFSLGLVIINFTGCVTKDIDTKTQVHTVKSSSSVKLKKVVKKEPKKALPKTKKEKKVEDYKTVVRENIKRNKNQKIAHKNFEKEKSKFLKEMEIARVEFTKTNDRDSYMKIKNRIIKKLRLAQLQLDKEIKKNEIINYRDKKNSKKL